eukprot:6475490-Prymnesium_polylepis.1
MRQSSNHKLAGRICRPLRDVPSRRASSRATAAFSRPAMPPSNDDTIWVPITINLPLGMAKGWSQQ